LSPSDFGFHNSLRRGDGRLVFLDFEYFGWDDPAKTVSDFLLHPAMELSPALRERFLTGALKAFGDPGLGARVRAVYPLFGLKWCAILLNEFTLEHMERRCFADGAPGAWSGPEQLEKARRMLAGVMHDYPHFPIHP
jgi:thiamine kinase-like enzyme